MTPKDDIRQLIQRGKQLREQAKKATRGGLHSKGAPIVGDVLISKYVPHGYKSTARKVVKHGHKSSRESAKDQWRQTGAQFLSECESQVGQMSINAKNLTISGNSSRLVRKFNRARKIKGPLPFFDSVISVFEEIQTQDLIWNRDIPQELKQRKEILKQRKREKAQFRAQSKDIAKITKTVDLFDIKSISKDLKQYPSVQKSILGALYSLQRNDPDVERQCIISCRASIESLCIQIGGNKDWKTGLKIIYPSETDQKQVISIWNFLSGRGAHGGHEPTKKEAEYGLQITIATLKFIIKK